jgi:hypothetical protein
MSLVNKLLEFQKKAPAIYKDTDNDFFHSSYADINSYIKAIKPLLSECGMVILQPQSVDLATGKQLLHTVIVDAETGEKMESTILLKETADPQKFGSLLTYQRRYMLQSLLFLQATDDDAEGAMSEHRTSTPSKTTTSTKSKSVPNYKRF